MTFDSTAPKKVSTRIGWFPVILVAGAIGVAVPTLDVGWTPIERTHGAVSRKTDVWSLKHGHQCVIEVQTPLGVASTTFWASECSAVNWSVGQEITIDVRRPRLSTALVIMHDLAVRENGPQAPTIGSPLALNGIVAGQAPNFQCNANGVNYRLDGVFCSGVPLAGFSCFCGDKARR